MIRRSRLGRVGLVAATALLTAPGCGAEPSGNSAEGGNGRPPTTGALSGDAAASCVENYDVETLKGRDFAFDGTVAAIGSAAPDKSVESVESVESGESGAGYVPVTFDVHEWFWGGDRPEVTIAMAGPGVPSSDRMEAGSPEEYGVGTRLLVSGEPRWGGDPLDDPLAWMCGFTRFYDEQTALDWMEAADPSP